MIAIISIFVSAFAIAYNCKILLWKEQKAQNLECTTERFIGNPFSVDEYFERTEKLYTEILEQKERESDSEEHVIILWWGLDGLRLNKDGSNEWISKSKKRLSKKEKPIIQQRTVYRSEVITLSELFAMKAEANAGDMVYVRETNCTYVYDGGGWCPLYSSCACINGYWREQCCSTADYTRSLDAKRIQNQIAELDERNRRLQLQITQNEQNRIITEHIYGGKGNRPMISIEVRYK